MRLSAITYFRSVENASNLMNPNVSGLPIPSWLVRPIANKYKKLVGSMPLYLDITWVVLRHYRDSTWKEYLGILARLLRKSSSKT